MGHEEEEKECHALSVSHGAGPASSPSAKQYIQALLHAQSCLYLTPALSNPSSVSNPSSAGTSESKRGCSPMLAPVR